VSPDYFALEELVGLRPDFLFAVTVFDNDSGQAAPFTGPGLAMVNSLMRLAGGTNIFGSLKQSWTSVSWEKSPPPSPSASSSTTTAPHRRAEGEVPQTNPASKNPQAVRHHCFLTLACDEVTRSPRNAQAVVAMARWLHPAAFGLPADGS
jgi:iron complex transport system substrate-binding protein